MNYSEYQADLHHIHESEVYGLAVFDAAARVTRTPERREKWQRLKALEEQTLRRYLAYMSQTGQPVREPRLQALKGQAEGLALGLMPWHLAMRLVRHATHPFQKRFLRLKSHAQGPDKAFFDYVYAHEKALEAFASAELAGQQDSLKAVRALLEP